MKGRIKAGTRHGTKIHNGYYLLYFRHCGYIHNYIYRCDPVPYISRKKNLSKNMFHKPRMNKNYYAKLQEHEGHRVSKPDMFAVRCWDEMSYRSDLKQRSWKAQKKRKQYMHKNNRTIRRVYVYD